MRARLFTDEAEALAFVAEADRALGYPREESPATCRRVGPGPHVPWELVRTETKGAPMRHPSRAEWAVSVEGLERAAVDTAGAVELDTTWRTAAEEPAEGTRDL